jgi:L-threonylcarbamoyladenylate synthase
MRVITKDEFVGNSFRFIREIKDKLFIYPTDTIYGIGCDATNDELVKKIRKIKNTNQPFSIIPPSVDWIFQNCDPDPRLKEWMKKLPGPYTFILPLKNKDAISPAVILGIDSIGIRIPKHWFTKVVHMLEIPIITTSANKTGDNFMTSLDDLNPDIMHQVDFIIDEGIKKSRPSTIIHFKKDIEIKER